jgi:hypothetical protein
MGSERSTFSENGRDESYLDFIGFAAAITNKNNNKNNNNQKKLINQNNGLAKLQLYQL